MWATNRAVGKDPKSWQRGYLRQGNLHLLPEERAGRIQRLPRLHLGRNLFHAGTQIVTLGKRQRSDTYEEDAQNEFGDERLGKFQNN